MQTHLISYADGQMNISQQLCTKSAKEKGKIDQVYEFGPASIDAGFYKRYKKVLESPQRGGGKGFWLWKPYVVEETIRALKEGDILIYCDAGVEWVNDVKYLLSLMRHTDVLLFGNSHRHIDWCKAEVWAPMLKLLPNWDYGGQGLIKQEQVQASVMLFRVNDYTREFCSRWLAWSCVPGFVDDTVRGPQLNEFREHRNDQSVLTNLAIEDNIRLHWWPAQYGHSLKYNYGKPTYPQMFYHHRYRNAEWFKMFPQNETIETWFNQFMKQPKTL